jgi:hypothetical protein
VASGSLFAVMTTWFPRKDLLANMTQIETEYVFPTCAFFRRDLVNSCGDGVVDSTLGEECELMGVACDIRCHCESGYKPHEKPQLNCVKDKLHVWTVILIAGSAITGTVLLLLLIALGVVPYLRKRYMRLGATLMRSSLISRRYVHSSRQVNPTEGLASPLAPQS